MRIMALDVGSKRIGVALSDPLKITAQGLETFQRKTLEEDVKGLWKLIDEHGGGASKKYGWLRRF